MRPRIGITGPDRGGAAAWLFTSMAVHRAGGRPVRITPGKPRSLDGLAGLIIGGGADVDPGLYGEAPVAPPLKELRRHSRSLPTFILTLLLFPLIWALRRILSTRQIHRSDADRDALETTLLQEALERGLPILGICRGAQLLNVVCGGTLHQHLNDFYDEVPQLNTIWPQKTVEIIPHSHLAGILGRDRCQVNSLHKQAIREPGESLQAVAREASTVIQAIEYTERHYVFGVQWHPEYLPQREEQRALFSALVEAAKSRHNLDSHTERQA